MQNILLFSTALLALKFRLIPEKVLPAFETIESLSELKVDLKLALSMIEDLDKFISKIHQKVNLRIRKIQVVIIDSLLNNRFSLVFSQLIPFYQQLLT